jgi:flagellar motility protein MotE (MotC chaperone)
MRCREKGVDGAVPISGANPPHYGRVRPMEETMHLRSLAASAALASLLGATAHAEDVERYRLEKTESGFVRMDTQTGAMSTCQEKDGQLVCRMAADERAAFQDEVDRLQGQVKGLDERVAKLENSLSARLESSLPSEEDFNRTMTYMERFLRGFMGIVKDMNKDEAVPQKT